MTMHEAWRWRDLFGSMRVRILAALVILLVGSSAISIAVLRNGLLARLDEEVKVKLRKEAQEFQLLATGVSERTKAPLGDDLKVIFDRYLRQEVADEGESLLAFIGDDLYRSERASGVVEAAHKLDNAIAHWISLEEREEGRLDTPVGPVRYVAIPLAAGSQKGLFVVANFSALEQGEINAAVLRQALTQFGTILIGSLLGIALAGRVLSPLRSLADTAETISETDLTRRIPVRGQDEASRIALAFNDMLGRIERAFATQRQFLDDASHELRVPLTIIRGHIEIIEFETDPVERNEMIMLITNEIERMSRILEDLLLLAKAERPDYFEMESIDVARLTHDIYRKAAVLATREWRLESIADIVIRADWQRLTQAMMQLAHNACAHTVEGSFIAIGSQVEDGVVTFWVHDDGPGVSPADAKRIFKRFVKVSESSGGSGLGLSIVAAIAEAHGGYARVGPHHSSGARFEIIVPTTTGTPPPAP